MTPEKVVFICQRLALVLLTAAVVLIIIIGWALLAPVHAGPQLPAYPPAVCVTIAGKPEPCENRLPTLPMPPKPQLQSNALEGTTCLNKNARTLTAATEPCKFKGPTNSYLGIDDLYPPVIIRNDEGGVIKLYVERYNLLKDRLFIIDGDCNSACTLVLGRPHVCATPKARFNFHAAKKPDDSFSPVGTAFIMEQYPPKVRAWIEDNGGLTKQWLTVRATMFVDKCKERV